MGRHRIPPALLLIFTIAAPSVARPATLLSTLLDRATAYTSAYMQEFSTLVAEERYVQDARTTAPGGASKHVELRSDLLFVQPDPSDNWITFRDVFSVNGRPVRDHDQRLAKLFTEPGARRARAIDIVREGYRYDIASRDRTVANPVLALAFLQAVYRPRFDFTLGSVATSLGDDVWIVGFKERVRPTIIRTTDNHNVFSSGRLWIDGASGRVLQTELETSTGDRVMTVFAFDERLQMGLPSEMRDLAWHDETIVTGSATYVNFRRFDVTTDATFR